jgi:hypothetical protein
MDNSRLFAKTEYGCASHLASALQRFHLEVASTTPGYIHQIFLSALRWSSGDTAVLPRGDRDSILSSDCLGKFE